MVLLGSRDGLEQRLHIVYGAKQFAQPTGEREREEGSEEKQGVAGTKRTWVMAEGLEWKCNSSSTSPNSQVACLESSLCGAELGQAGSIRAPKLG